jgi:cytochrome P450
LGLCHHALSAHRNRDYELNGKLIRKGDKVVIWYISADFDERQFANLHL